MQRFYFDNAATSWPKPAAVYDAVDTFQRTVGVAGSRGNYQQSLAVDRLTRQTRQAICDLIGGTAAENIVFTLNGSDSLNHVLHGILQPGDHVVTTVCEHNSVLRPLNFLTSQLGIEVSYAGCDEAGYVSPEEIKKLLRPNTKLVALIHGSNVTGAVQPITEVGEIVKSHPAFFMVDAAQTLGYVPINVEESAIDFLTAPGHKGLLGTLGTGLLYIRPSLEQTLIPLRQGGSGLQSELETLPTQMPSRFEVGNLNMVGIIGLHTALTTYFSKHSITEIQTQQQNLTNELLVGLQKTDVTLYGPQPSASDVSRAGSENLSRRIGVVSMTFDNLDPSEASAILDTSFGIQARSGLHCAPRMHQSLKTLTTGGTLRLSLGHFTTHEEIAYVIEAISQIA